MRTDLHDRAMRLVASAVVQLFSALPDRVSALASNRVERAAIRKCLVDELHVLRATLASSGAEVYMEIAELVAAKVEPSE